MAAPRYWRTVCTLNAATLVPAKAAVTGRTHHVTKVVPIITTHANAKFIRVQDSAATPIIVYNHLDYTAAAGVTETREVNYGSPRQGGFPCTVSKAVNVVSESAGPAGTVLVEGYTT